MQNCRTAGIPLINYVQDISRRLQKSEYCSHAVGPAYPKLYLINRFYTLVKGFAHLLIILEGKILAKYFPLDLLTYTLIFTPYRVTIVKILKIMANR